VWGRGEGGIAFAVGVRALGPGDYLDPKPKVFGSNLDRNVCLSRDSSRAAAFYEFTTFWNVRWNVILVVTTVSHGVSERGS